MKYLSYGVVLAAIISSGCASNQADNRETLLKIVIAKYNNAVIEAYKSQNFEPLKQAATESEINKIGVIINAYRTANQIMESDIKKIDFKEIRIEADKADVKTYEDWSYRWINYETRQEAEPLKDIHYELFYHLIKKDGKWLVDRVEDMKK